MLPELSEGPARLGAPFEVGEALDFRLLLTNGSSEKIDIPIAGPYEHNRPRLFKGAETKWATPDQQMLEVYFTVKNVGRKPIRAYTVRVIQGLEAQEGGGCFLNNTERPGKILHPNQSAGRSTWRPVPPSDPPPAVDLALDFVEFTDGSVWGGDACQSAERLSGLRAGARVAKVRFKRKLDEKGVEALLGRLYTDDPELAPPEGHSDAWKAGFRGAINSLRERIRRANEEGGSPKFMPPSTGHSTRQKIHNRLM